MTIALGPLLEAMPVAVMVVDENHSVVLVNEPAATLFGYTTEELRGLSFVQLCPRMADEVKRPCGPAGMFMRSGRAARCGERRMAVARCKDGSERPVSVQCVHYGAAGAARWIGISWMRANSSRSVRTNRTMRTWCAFPN